MRKSKALLDCIQFTIPEKIPFYYNVIDKLTDNAQFTKPDVTLEEAKAAVDSFEAAYLATKDRAIQLLRQCTMQKRMWIIISES
jgi:hypothetical protein